MRRGARPGGPEAGSTGAAKPCQGFTDYEGMCGGAPATHSAPGLPFSLLTGTLSLSPAPFSFAVFLMRPLHCHSPCSSLQAGLTHRHHLKPHATGCNKLLRTAAGGRPALTRAPDSVFLSYIENKKINTTSQGLIKVPPRTADTLDIVN